MHRVLPAAFLPCLFLVATAHAQWGNFKAQFIVKGDVPKPEALKIAGAMCGAKAPVDETILMGKDGGLKNVVVYLRKEPGQEVPIHKTYDPKEPVNLDNKNCRFEPHLATVWNARKLHLTNSDKFGHNAALTLINNASSNNLIPPGSFVDLEFKTSEPLPMPVACGIHPWMAGEVLILDHPYMAVTDDEGKVEIKNVPEGTWTFVAWHEGPALITKPTVNGVAEAWAKGRFPVVIADKKTTDLGQAVLTPEQLKKKPSK